MPSSLSKFPMRAAKPVLSPETKLYWWPDPLVGPYVVSDKWLKAWKEFEREREQEARDSLQRERP